MLLSFLTLWSVALAVVFVQYLFGALDYIGFGHVLTQQEHGDPTQHTPYEDVPLLEKVIYRAVVQPAYMIGMWALLHFLGLTAVAVGSIVASMGMSQDFFYHVVGGHIGHPKYQPLGYGEKVKPWSIHYWPIRFYLLTTPLDLTYPDGVPQRWETVGRFVVLALGMIVAMILV